jgi:hypothetical protein
MYIQAIAEVKAGEVSSVQRMVQQKRKAIKQERLIGDIIGIHEHGIERNIDPRRSKQLVTTGRWGSRETRLGGHGPCSRVSLIFDQRNIVIWVSRGKPAFTDFMLLFRDRAGHFGWGRQ